MDDIIIQISEDVTLVVVESDEQIIQANEAGPPGPSEYCTSHIAGVSLSGHCAVVLNDSMQVIYADKNTPSHAGKVFGITLGASSLGGAAEIETYGEFTEPSWAWTPGLPIYLGNAGAITQTVPTSGFLLILGFALSATKIFIDIKQPIVLS